ncbi:50S ribosomal protein L19e [Candidatus Woesearchaeota archaeon]|nr:50S ribosomal protein L19e [Candidatus Woesearchaeota archaeon]
MIQKRLAATQLKCGPNRVRFDPERLEDIAKAITKHDIRQLISQGAIGKAQIRGTSRAAARDRQSQRKRGRRRGVGSRKGPATARQNPKQHWMHQIRSQRALLERMREHEIISDENHRILYYKAKGGFFRSQRHIKLYAKEQGMIKG